MLKKKATKKTPNGKLIKLPEARELRDEIRDLKSQLAMALAALYDMADTMNDFVPLVVKLEKTLKLSSAVSPTVQMNKGDNDGV